MEKLNPLGAYLITQGFSSIPFMCWEVNLCYEYKQLIKDSGIFSPYKQLDLFKGENVFQIIKKKKDTILSR